MVNKPMMKKVTRMTKLDTPSNLAPTVDGDDSDNLNMPANDHDSSNVALAFILLIIHMA